MLAAPCGVGMGAWASPRIPSRWADADCDCCRQVVVLVTVASGWRRRLRNLQQFPSAPPPLVTHFGASAQQNVPYGQATADSSTLDSAPKTKHRQTQNTVSIDVDAMAPTLSIIVYRNEIIIIIGTIERKVIIPNRIAQN